jgi:hypothetical protein
MTPLRAGLIIALEAVIFGAVNLATSAAYGKVAT